MIWKTAAELPGALSGDAVSDSGIPTAALEISPMFEEHWSGIPMVTAELAGHALGDSGVDWIFLHNNIVIPYALVELLLVRRSGRALLPDLADLAYAGNLINRFEASTRACVWPNVKCMAGWFAREAVIIHDLSTLIAPEFHNDDTINYHCDRVLHDCRTSDHIFCVSDATRRDVINYLRVPERKTSVIPLGARFEESDLYQACEQRRSIDVEPYIVIIGTIEPRKNGGMIIDLLMKYPHLLNGYQIVFIGREGWLDEKRRIMDQLATLGIASDRVVFTGYVSDEIKTRLLLNCAFAVYPSFFEGYGLPVLECAVLGKLCVASRTSSIVEVAPDMCIFFDPTDLESLRSAIEHALACVRLPGRQDPSFIDLCLAIEARGWHHCYNHVRNWLMSGEPHAS
ncbi:glycosyltransferase family 4 protein [Sphingobium lignivorans]|uniref:Glycosyltransferase involved in cell wall biosynthesis n=1 Tax=Sphingobium lignivorans TaxID=2735886 RepID=A0ABR6NEE4_9SPHN|nr:glycosyltransferase family 1 protein [Sphingobium lignivorans]MBB5985027.1 glycosyltransferase involved in cell wall biosynthesis [Sphingobium lignivorans]